MAQLWRLAPEFLVLAGALVALFADHLGRRSLASALAAACAFAAAAAVVLIGPGGELFGGALALDPTAVVARTAIAGLAAVWLLWLSGRGIDGERTGEAAAFALLAALGGMLMVAARDLIVLFVALELSTMPAYVLIGYRRRDERGMEGALKYFLLSMLTSLVLLYGFSFLYGLSGSTAYAHLSDGPSGVLRQLAYVFVLVGLFAKLSAAPFHYWTPDAYAGAPAASVAFVSTVPKIAGAVALVQLFGALSGGRGDVAAVLYAAAIISMLIGNFSAYPQRDVRRLMAYSGIAHTGYLLLGVAAGSAGYSAAVFYAVAYAAPSMAIVLLAAEEGSSLDELAGLASRRPALAWASVAWLLSLVGIPPMVGFFGKLYLFTSVISGGRVWPVLIAVLMTAVSAGYYFRVLREVFFGERADGERLPGSIAGSIALAALALVTLGLGLLASPLLAFLGVSF